MNVSDAFEWVDNNKQLVSDKSIESNIDYDDAINVAYEAAVYTFLYINDHKLSETDLPHIFNRYFQQLIVEFRCIRKCMSEMHIITR